MIDSRMRISRKVRRFFLLQRFRGIQMAALKLNFMYKEDLLILLHVNMKKIILLKVFVTKIIQIATVNHATTNKAAWNVNF